MPLDYLQTDWQIQPRQSQDTDTSDNILITYKYIYTKLCGSTVKLAGC